MASYPSKLIFPSWCLEEATVEDEFATSVTETRGAEYRNAGWEDSRLTVDLSGSLVSEAQRRQLRAFFRAIKGKYRTFWFRRWDDEEWELSGPDGQGEWLGDGNGVKKTFQARVYETYQGSGTEYVVRCLDHEIPPLGTRAGGGAATATRRVEVFLGGVRQTLGTHYSVNRETGEITFTSAPGWGVSVRLRGGFYVEMRANQDTLPLTPTGGGWYEIAEGFKLIEPKGLRASGGESGGGAS